MLQFRGGRLFRLWSDRAPSSSAPRVSRALILASPERSSAEIVP
jgi:hypothetical protein